MKLLPIGDQVIVITGASSGIGLTTARLAARAGARVVLTARDEETLKEEVARIRASGGEATYLAGDVANAETLPLVARHAVTTFGRIDTWVNNAGIGVYGLAEEVSLADMRRLFDVTFWGVVHGCLAAVPHLREHGGALINVGSIESEMPMPYHSAYSAAKHAVKGFTNSLRIELEHDGAPVSVTLLKPAAIDTPFFEHAKNYLDGNPKPPPPAYAPDVVARAILRCAERPVRDLVVGGSGRALIGLTRLLPRATDHLYAATMFDAQKTDRHTRHDRAGALYTTGPFNGRERGQYDGVVRRRSFTTDISLRSTESVLGVALLGAAVFGLTRMLKSPSWNGGRGRDTAIDLRATQRWTRQDSERAARLSARRLETGPRTSLDEMPDLTRMGN